MCRLIISHRLRGFDVHDATQVGLQYALDSGVRGIEIDTRITHDGIIVINHDASLQEHFNSNMVIANIQYETLKTISYKKKSGTILTLNQLLEVISSHRNTTCQLFLDVKETGYEGQIVTLLDRYCMVNRTVIISWLPEVLCVFSSYQTGMSLCFSHYKVSGRIPAGFLQLSVRVGELFRQKPVLTKIAYNSYNSAMQNTTANSAGLDYEHIVKNYISGELAEILKNSNGAVCCSYKMFNKTDFAYYKDIGIKTMIYSVDTTALLQKYKSDEGPDFILTNNAELCFHSGKDRL